MSLAIEQLPKDMKGMDKKMKKDKLSSTISRIKNTMTRNQFLCYLVDIARKSGLVYLYHIWLCNDKEQAAKFSAFYVKNMDNFEAVQTILADDFSRLTLQKVVECRRTTDIRVLKGINIKPQYFIKDILKPIEGEVFVDGGAYIGDTIKKFLKTYIGKHSYTIYAWEPDPQNRKLLEKNTRNLKIKIIPYGLWNKKDKLNFNILASGISNINEYGGGVIYTDCIDNIHKETRITFIKMDIEGAEIEALYGAKETILSQKPKLAICIYHKPEHLYAIPQLIHKWVPEYKLYIRHHSDNIAETVLYATL